MTVSVDLSVMRNKRLAAGYSYREISQKLGYKTATGYWLVENNERKLSIGALYKLSQLYKCSMEDLIKID